jgi:lysophospholipase L1-like esterase
MGNLLLLGCAILMSLSAGELFVRRYYPIGETIFQLDQRYLHRLRPNSRQISRLSAVNGGNKVLVTINGEGRRGDLVSMSRPRVLVYGDSFIASNVTPINQTFVWQLERKLKRTFASGPQVVNCGVSGYGPDQESLVLEDEIDHLKPQLVIVAIYVGNDFGDLLRDKIYKLDDKMQLKDNHYTIDPSLVSLFATSEQFPRLYSVRLLQKAWARLTHGEDPTLNKYILPRSLSSKDYLEEWLLESREEYEEYIVKGDNSVRNLFEDHYDADVSLTPDSESSQYKRILMDRVIEKIQQITAARSVPLMLVIIPSPFDVVDHYVVSVDAAKYPGYRRSELTDIIEGIARKHQLPYVNLFAPFREHGAGSLYYVVDNDHWNPEGQQLAASLVGDYITQQHLLYAPAGVR